jgi:hypothetical protein
MGKVHSRRRLTIRWPLNSDAMRLEALLVAAVIAGCTSTRPMLGAHQACMLDPQEWSDIDTPANRAELLSQRPKNSPETTVQQHLAMQSHDVERWLRSADGKLSVCVYDPLKSLCNGGKVRMVEFEQAGGGLVARMALEVVCVTLREPADKPLVPTRNGEAPLLASYARR